MMTTDLMTGRSRGLSLKATLAAVVATLAVGAKPGAAARRPKKKKKAVGAKRATPSR